MLPLQPSLRTHGFWQSVGFAWQGLCYLARYERNFKIHLVLAVMAFVTAFWIGFARWEWIVLILSTGLMLSVEALNTAIELLVDRLVGDSKEEIAGRIKDIAAGACLLMATALGIIGIFLFLPHLWIYSSD
jgi:diacylglycerol kinase